MPSSPPTQPYRACLQHSHPAVQRVHNHARTTFTSGHVRWAPDQQHLRLPQRREFLTSRIYNAGCGRPHFHASASHNSDTHATTMTPPAATQIPASLYHRPLAFVSAGGR